MGRRILGFHDGYETYFFILVHDKHNMNILNSPTSRETLNSLVTIHFRILSFINEVKTWMVRTGLLTYDSGEIT